MATEPIVGLEEVDGSESDGSSGGVLKKPSPAVVQRSFAGPSDAAVGRAFDEAMAKAEQAGWEVVFVSSTEDGFIADRDMDGHLARLTVSVIEDPDLGPVPGLAIRLSATVE